MSAKRNLKRVEDALFELEELQSRAMFRDFPIRTIRRASARLGLGIVVGEDPGESKLSRIATSLESMIE
jgi:hypothetical protein